MVAEWKILIITLDNMATASNKTITLLSKSKKLFTLGTPCKIMDTIHRFGTK